MSQNKAGVGTCNFPGRNRRQHWAWFLLRCDFCLFAGFKAAFRTVKKWPGPGPIFRPQKLSDEMGTHNSSSMHFGKARHWIFQRCGSFSRKAAQNCRAKRSAWRSTRLLFVQWGLTVFGFDLNAKDGNKEIPKSIPSPRSLLSSSTAYHTHVVPEPPGQHNLPNSQAAFAPGTHLVPMVCQKTTFPHEPCHARGNFEKTKLHLSTLPKNDKHAKSANRTPRMHVLSGHTTVQYYHLPGRKARNHDTPP
jgi:hypothetical protein